MWRGVRSESRGNTAGSIGSIALVRGGHHATRSARTRSARTRSAPHSEQYTYFTPLVNHGYELRADRPMNACAGRNVDEGLTYVDNSDSLHVSSSRRPMRF
jgi:hypothetical protein